MRAQVRGAGVAGDPMPEVPWPSTRINAHAYRSEWVSKKESGPRGRERCAGEPVLRRWSSPRFIRHSGLADTAHRTDCRVELLFNECRFNQLESPTCFAGRFLLRIVGSLRGNYKSCAMEARCATVFTLPCDSIKIGRQRLRRFGITRRPSVFRQGARRAGNGGWRHAPAPG